METRDAPRRIVLVCVEVMRAFTYQIFIVFFLPRFALDGVETNEINNTVFLTSRNSIINRKITFF